MAVKHLVAARRCFSANYSDGLTDVPLDDMIDRFKRAIRSAASSPSTAISFLLRSLASTAKCKGCVRARSRHLDQRRIFIFRNKIFVSSGRRRIGGGAVPRLIEGGHLMAYKYEGFWRAMDTLRDRQLLEEMSNVAIRHGA